MDRILTPRPLIYPLPALVVATYNEDGSVNAMLAAWGCPIDSDMVGICLSSDHKTVENIHREKAFSLFLATEDTIEASDYFGLVSGYKDPHKLETVGYHSRDGEKCHCPIIEEYSIGMECVFDHEEPDTGMIYGKVLAIHAKEEVMDANGHIDLAKAKIVSFDGESRTYRRLGEPVAVAYQSGNRFKK
ncbi:MAG: flavin reductase family protein [Candidatus Enteromonas sp.]